MSGEGRDGAEDSQQVRLMRAQLPAGATVTDPGGRVHFRRSGTLVGATAGDGGHGGSLSRFDEVMPLSTYCQRCGWAAD